MVDVKGGHGRKRILCPESQWMRLGNWPRNDIPDARLRLKRLIEHLDSAALQLILNYQ